MRVFSTYPILLVNAFLALFDETRSLDGPAPIPLLSITTMLGIDLGGIGAPLYQGH